ncbi:hypothetical protein MKW94_023862 [Papaver nudicaule]|uniref:Homeobox domain-containing protein n=1 Tax=Papaver nudicaule TaxID=74823 RepID=A0AA41V0E0_PAPNU|nr:hypothetical protein [Papaver nudicaule]
MYNTSRWNPTKEQIDMLEGFYNAGITCPRDAEIQHMTSKLRVYGDVEGKNVYYWFQNHKARRRQRQRQVRHAYVYDPRLHYNHQQFLQHQISSPMVLAPCTPAPFTNGNPLVSFTITCPLLVFCFQSRRVSILGPTTRMHKLLPNVVLLIKW